MIDSIKFFELCEKFSENSLSKEEKNYLNELISNNPILKNEFIQNLEIIKKIKQLSEKKEIIKKIKSININFIKRKRRIKKIYTYTILWLITALIAISSTIITLQISGWFDFKQKLNKYINLSNKIKITIEKQGTLWDKLYPEKKEITITRGTAFLINNEGYLLTNKHIVIGQDSVFITNKKDSLFANIIYIDSLYDIAILKAKNVDQFKEKKIPYIINFSPSYLLSNKIFTLSFVKDKDIIFSEGFISSYTGYEDDTTMVQTSLSLNLGSSGSPIFNPKLEVIGIVCGKVFENNFSSFFIKTNYLKDIFNKLNINYKPNYKFYKSLTKKNKEEQITILADYIYKVETLQ